MAAFVLGALLLLIAILGGNFKVFGAEIAERVANPFIRFISLLIGVVLVGWTIVNTPPPPPPAPATPEPHSTPIDITDTPEPTNTPTVEPTITAVALPAMLQRADVQFFTTDDNKDGDTQVMLWLKCNGSTIASTAGMWGEFGNGTTSPVISLDISESLAKEAFPGNCVVELNEAPNGHDEWHFNWRLKLYFSDNGVKRFDFTGGNVDYDRTFQRWPLET
jgi:hypothetical protein